MTNGRRFLFGALALFTAVATAAPLDTSTYFPLTPGSHWSYAYTSGLNATTEVSVAANQSWAGQTGLTALVSTGTCAPSAGSCVVNKSDFYGSDADGVWYFGFNLISFTHVNANQTYTQPDLTLKNPVDPTLIGGATPSGVGVPGGWAVPVSGQQSQTGAFNAYGVHQAIEIVTLTVPAGTFGNVLHVKSGGVDTWYAPCVGLVKYDGGTTKFTLTSYTVPSCPVGGNVTPPADGSLVTVVEFYHAGLDHFFISGLAAEVTALDSGMFKGWVRTGYWFNAVGNGTATPAGASPVCRFYGLPSAGLDSHFYSASPAECATVSEKFASAWELEASDVFQVYLPNSTTGACPMGTHSVYRAWNNRADSNHRYTTNPTVLAQMVAKGYVAEGYGNPPVVMCAPVSTGNSVACTLTASNPTPQVGNIITLTASCTGNPTTYAWTNCGNSQTATCPDKQMEASTRVYTVQATNAGGLTAQATVSVVWSAPPVGATPVCTLISVPATTAPVNGLVRLNATCDANAPFEWKNCSNMIGSTVCAATSASPGAVTYQVRATNANGLGAWASHTVTYY